MDEKEERVEISSSMVTMEDNIDRTIGFYYWKRYVASAFWANISTPINLAITLLTALTTAQATTSNLFSSTTTSNLSITAFVLTIINTFFKPHLQMTQNVGLMEDWNKMGTNFEEIFFDDKKFSQKEEFMNRYKKLQSDMNELRKMDGPDTTNFVTDLIHYLSTKCCLRNIYWLDEDMKKMVRHEKK
jgi:hypothetical protein